MVQVNNTPIVLRVKFFKKGNLQYISHLDLVRTMMKVIVRSGLPLKYTEGFNPKPKLTFAAPLSIGTESLAEFMDIRLFEKMDTDEAVRALNANMAPEMQAIEAYYPDTRLTNLAWLSYRISIDTLGDAAENAKKCESVFSKDQILVEKKGKDDAVFDIKPLIKEISIKADGALVVIDAIISADQSRFLNPEYLIKALRSGAGILSSPDIAKEGYSIVRLEGYDKEMNIFR